MVASRASPSQLALRWGLSLLGAASSHVWVAKHPSSSPPPPHL